MGFTNSAIPVPLREDASGTIRVGKTRVTLDVLLTAYKMGESAEEIVESFPTLQLADVHYVIGYYLQNREAIDAYLQKNEEEAALIQAEIQSKLPNTGIREKLLQRMAARNLKQSPNH